MRDLIQLLADLDLLRVVKAFALIWARVMPLVVLVPLFGGKGVPQRIKVGISVVLAIFLYPLVGAPALTHMPSEIALVVTLLLKEVFLGLTLGFVASIVFHAVMTSGRLLDLARGASMASMMDPMFGEQASHMGLFLFQLVIQIALLTNMHLAMLNGFFMSYEVLAIDQFPTIGAGLSLPILQVLRLTALVWIIGIQLNMPAFLIVFLVDGVMGVVGKISPQIKIHDVAAPTKMLAGIAIVGLGLTMIIHQMKSYLVELTHMMEVYVRLLARGV